MTSLECDAVPHLILWMWAYPITCIQGGWRAQSLWTTDRHVVFTNQVRVLCIRQPKMCSLFLHLSNILQSESLDYEADVCTPNSGYRSAVRLYPPRTSHKPQGPHATPSSYCCSQSCQLPWIFFSTHQLYHKLVHVLSGCAYHFHNTFNNNHVPLS